jgi:hypothetical protein
MQAFRGETEETLENLIQDTATVGHDLNPGPPEYEARLLTTQTATSTMKPRESGFV